MSECPHKCDSSNHLVSIIVDVNFLLFGLLFNKCYTILFQNLCGYSLGGPITSLLKSRSYPYISWNYR